MTKIVVKIEHTLGTGKPNLLLHFKAKLDTEERKPDRDKRSVSSRISSRKSR